SPRLGPQCPEQLRSELENKLSSLGYDRIVFLQEGSDLLVTAQLDDQVLGAVFDMPSGALMAQDVWRASGQDGFEGLA
ncbi:MAG: hypothetical protein AB3N24_06570, partial [Leisingera sp.]